MSAASDSPGPPPDPAAAGSGTLLLTDVVDSTLLTRELGDARMSTLWAAHDRLARDLLRRWNGREIDKSDGFLLLFDTPPEALGYALAYHRAIAALPTPLSARAGIHHGPLTLRETPAADVARGAKPLEVEGLAKPVAARVMALARGGQTLLSAQAHALLADGTDAPWRLRSHGHWRFKGLDEPMEVFEAGDPQAPGAPPVDGPKAWRVLLRDDGLWQPAQEPPHSLPSERDAFIGRAEALQALARQFEDGARLVSVLGIGGSGKTRLVTRYAWAWLGDYRGGAWFCDLAQARGTDGLLYAVAQGLDLPLGGGDAVRQIGEAIAARGDCLVILDNFEQVVDRAEATLGHWLDRAPRARFVVTSREVLGIVGERALALPPLEGGDAQALFRQRAAAAGAALPVPGRDHDDDAAVAQLVTMLDGLPLAIELAAARARAMPLRTLLARMGDRFAVLGSRGGRSRRQATLRAAFDWSWDLLPAAERSALAQLSVFRGGFTLEAAEAVVEPPAGDAEDAGERVLALVDKSLVRKAAGERFDLLESVREYAAEHLAAAGRFDGSGPAARDAAERRHGCHYADLGTLARAPLARFDADNLVAACRRACRRRDAATAAATLIGAWSAIRVRGPFSAGLALAEELRQACGDDPLAAAAATLVHGLATELCGSAADAERSLVEAARGAQALERHEWRLRALQRLAALQARQGFTGPAEASATEALNLAARLDQPALHVAVLNSLGGLCDQTGRPAEAQAHYVRALQIARDTGDRAAEGVSAQNLAQSLANQGRREAAMPHYERAITLAAELGNRLLEAEARCNLGLLLIDEDRPVDAERELQASHALATELGHRQLAAIVLCNSALVREAFDDLPEARRLHEAAWAIAQQIGDSHLAAQCLTYLGRLQARGGDAEAAQRSLDTAETGLRAAGDRAGLVLLECARAETAHGAGHHDEAERSLDRARLAAEALGALDERSEVAKALRACSTLLGVATSAVATDGRAAQPIPP